MPGGPRSGGRPWVVLRQGARLRWGGDFRRRWLFDPLVERTDARVVEGWSIDRTRKALEQARGPAWRIRGTRASVASTEYLGDDALAMVSDLGRPLLVDIHDEPVLQHEILGIDLDPDGRAALRHRHDTNVETFAWLSCPSRSFATLASLDPDRTIVAANGSDTRHIVVRPMPATPTVGFASGAAPKRGIETLIEAVRLARLQEPELSLRLFLVATGEGSAAYLDGLRAEVAVDPWISISQPSYEELSDAFGSASILCVPNPPNAYWDAVLPIKLPDSMAAGRPVVVTPRIEMAAIVRATDVGLVASGDRPEDLADAFLRLAGDADLSARLGANARRTAETTYDWRVIGQGLADELLARLG